MAFGALTFAFGCDNRSGDTDGGGIHLSGDAGHTTGTPDSGPTSTPDSGTAPPPDRTVSGDASGFDLPLPCAASPSLLGVGHRHSQCIDADPNAVRRSA